MFFFCLGQKAEKGSKGAEGISGQQGDKGDEGAQGQIGPIGPKGEVGDPGIDGEPGPKGLLSFTIHLYPEIPVSRSTDKFDKRQFADSKSKLSTYNIRASVCDGVIFLLRTMVTVVGYLKNRRAPLFSVFIATSDFEESRTLDAC